MDRRGFLRLLGLGAAGAVLDPERLLWVPGQKTILLPPTQVFVPQPPLLTMITREALRVLQNNLEFTRHVSRHYDRKFVLEGARIGSTVTIRKPPRYVTEAVLSDGILNALG